MTEAAVLYSVNAQVATVTLNRPDRGNALTGDLLQGEARYLSIFNVVFLRPVNFSYPGRS